jgi:hypothetical protein
VASFKNGDRVAWHHAFATQHAPGSIVHAPAVPSLDKKHPLHGEPGTGQLGTIVGPGNDEKTWWEVEFDGGKKTLVLTEDELVRIHEEEPAR